jgi:hypothetical protein
VKTKTRTFDCVAMMHCGALWMYEETKGMSVQEEVAYWRQRHGQGLKTFTERGSESPRDKERALAPNSLI